MSQAVMLEPVADLLSMQDTLVLLAACEAYAVWKRQEKRELLDLKAIFSLGTTLALGGLNSRVVQQHMQRVLLLLVFLCEFLDRSAPNACCAVKQICPYHASA